MLAGTSRPGVEHPPLRLAQRRPGRQARGVQKWWTMNIRTEVSSSGTAHCVHSTDRTPPARNAVPRLYASS